MKPSSEKYLRPQSLSEALSLLSEDGTVVLAGGTYLVAEQRHRGRRLLDLSQLQLDHRVETAAEIKCGAMTRLQDFLDFKSLPEPVERLLTEAVRATTPSWMVRNLSTVGGELVQRSRHSAIAVALLALGAEVTLVTGEGERRLSLDEFSRARGAHALSPFILVEVIIPKPGANRRAAFRRLAQLPSQPSIAVAAVSLELEHARMIRVRAALGSSVAAPRRLHQLEQQLTNLSRDIATEKLRALCQWGLQDVEFAPDGTVNADYLRAMSEVVLQRTCLDLLQR